MEFKHATLENGLDVVAEVNAAARSMAAGFFVKTGSRDETPEVSGVSHFLEHMVFKGTGRRTVFDVNREFDEMGAEYNAFTSEENTVFYGAALPEHLSGLIDLLGDILRPSLRQEDFDVEKNVILDEIALYEDRPQFRIYDKLMATYFRGHPLGNMILGTPESIRALTREQMLEYFRRRYSPGNVTLTACGHVDFDHLVGEAREACGHWEPVNVARETPELTPPVGTSAIVDEKLSRQHIGIVSPAPSAQDHQRFAARVLAAVLGDSTGSRLYYALVDPAIADDAHTSYDPMDHAGAFMTFLTCDPDKTAEAVRITREEFRRFCDEGPTDAELAAARNKIASASTLRGEIPMGRLASVGFDWVYRGEYIPLAEQIETLLSVSREEVMDVANACDPTRMTLLGLGPVGEL